MSMDFESFEQFGSSNESFEHTSAGAFLHGARTRFEAENDLVRPKKIYEHIPDYLYVTPHTDCVQTDIGITKLMYFTENVRKPSLQEQLDSMEKVAEHNRSWERQKHGGRRERHNFGHDFILINKFSLDTEDLGSILSRRLDKEEGKEVREAIINPHKEVGLTNRVSLYRYLQQRGVILVDDIGLSVSANYITGQHKPDTDNGFVFLPKSIDPDIYFEFEHIIRETVPFGEHEVEAAMIRAEIETGRKPEPSELLVEDKAMRELVDYLATDERFLPLFESADQRRQDRLSYGRETI